MADHYSKIDGELQKSTSLKILEHTHDMGLNEVKIKKKQCLPNKEGEMTQNRLTWAGLAQKSKIKFKDFRKLGL